VNTRAVAALSVLLVAIFAAIAVSVVDARGPLDGNVNRSFHVAFAAALTSHEAAGTAADCHKLRVDYYRCRGLVRLRGDLQALGVDYLLALTEDGCWTTRPFSPASPEPGLRFPDPSGCVAR
jgi:hypothetical protein